MSTAIPGSGPVPVPTLAANGADTILPASHPDMPPSLIAQQGGVLEQLMAQHASIKQLADAYATQLKDLTDKIKVHAIGAVPGVDAVVLRAAHVTPLKLSHYDRTNFNRNRFKDDHPGIDTKPYETVTTIWTLRAVSG